MIAPVYESLSKQYTSVNFLKCDVDAARDVASRYSISAMYALSLLYLFN
jgi:thioredoxin 1